MNELHLETSPYLLQHAANPVHWKAWNDHSLEKARSENKLIIISVGYSACHWCHVMEHESFEDEEVAQVMNNGFVAIKVDREERPDVDAVYMKAVQLMTGQGGWPMNVVALPDGRPVWGGTYFRKNNWIEALEQLREIYAEQPEKMYDYAEKLMAGVQHNGLLGAPEEGPIPDPSGIKPIVEKWAHSFDTEYGGYGRAPKFMLPNNFLFLQRYGYQAKSNDLLEHVDLTLTRMAWGGLFDVVGGGFSRYSVDVRWHVPHFEKMLYDNGQLMSLYAQAYKRTGNSLYKEVIEKTHFFIANELTDPTGAFYSAWDADSANAHGRQEEGAFYTWEKQELKDLLEDDFELFASVYNINEFGFWEDGRFVLIQTDPLEKQAEKAGLTVEKLRDKKTEWEQLLYEAREHRVKPGLDDKILTSWNALMLKGYADAYKALEIEDYLLAAQRNAEFITGTMWSPEGHLWRTCKNGKAKIHGFLDDYAHTADGFITLYEATLEEQWLIYARQLTDYCLEHFYDPQERFFAYTASNAEKLVAPHYEIEDNVIPSSNSVMANVLYKLSLLFDNSNYEKVALEMLYRILPGLDYPSAFSNWLNLWIDLSADNRELAVCGEGAAEAVKSINASYLPYVLVAGCTKESDVPLLKGRFVEKELMFYVCRNRSCQMPVRSAEAALEELRLSGM